MPSGVFASVDYCKSKHDKTRQIVEVWEIEFSQGYQFGFFVI